MYVMLWRIDAGDYAGALEIGRSCPASWLGDAAG